MLEATRLPCGAVLLVDRTRAGAVAAVQVWSRAGAADAGVPGAAHFLEHLLFKGSAGLGPGEAPARFEAMGGELNAVTSHDWTALVSTVPPRRAAEALGLLLELALRPLLDPEEIALERGVVAEEAREADDDPDGRLGDEVRRRTWGEHPLGWPVLGDAASVGALDPAALGALHARHWAPRLLVVSVAGPVDAEAIRAVLDERLPREGGPALPPRPPAPPRPVVPGAFVLDGGFEERLVELAFPAPPPGAPELAALDLLSVALGEGLGSLLGRSVVHGAGAALSSWGTLETGRQGSALLLGLAPRRGRVREAVAHLGRLLTRVRREGVPAGALLRARAAVRADRLAARETAEGRAWRRAWSEVVLGDPEGVDAYEASVGRVRLADLHDAAARVLDPDRAVIGAVAPPEEIDAGALSEALAPLRVARPRPARPRLLRERLSNGLTVVLLPDPDAELAAVSVVGVGGTAVVGPALAGGWAGALLRGAGELDAIALSAELEVRAATLEAWAGRTGMGVNGAAPADEFGVLLDLLGRSLRAPRWAPEEVARVRADLEEDRRRALEDPWSRAHALAWGALMRGHPYGRSAPAPEGAIRRVTPGRLRRVHARVATGANLVVGLAGAVDRHDALDALERHLGRLPRGEPLRPPPAPEPPARPLRRRARVGRPGAPAAVLVAVPAPRRGHPDDAAAQVLAAVLGGAAGRLWVALRERGGMAYDVFAEAEAALSAGVLACGAGTDPARAGEALRALRAELAAVAGERPPGRDEVERARAGVAEGARAAVERAGALAESLAGAERFGPGAERHLALADAAGRVGADEVARVARRLLGGGPAVEVLVLPGEPPPAL